MERGDRRPLPNRVEGTVVLHTKLKQGRGTRDTRDSVILHFIAGHVLSHLCTQWSQICFKVDALEITVRLVLVDQENVFAFLLLLLWRAGAFLLLTFVNDFALPLWVYWSVYSTSKALSSIRSSSIASLVVSEPSGWLSIILWSWNLPQKIPGL